MLSLQEPVAFAGGMFAGLLRLDLNEDPLKEWVTRTVEASGISEEEIDDEGSKPEEVPQQIEIEWLSGYPGFLLHQSSLYLNLDSWYLACLL